MSKPVQITVSGKPASVVCRTTMANFMEVAGDLFKTCPGINRVQLSDVVAKHHCAMGRFPERYFLYKSGPFAGYPDCIPEEIFDLLEWADGDADWDNSARSCVAFYSNKAFSDALSAACVAYGKRQAG